ncbi:hypothetical protein LY76DRAFT_593603 [Colletotrichum caudatum]|nr:hypothetical protein LY76DRAFT_593603 [Colletotrichum caudatum]
MRMFVLCPSLRHTHTHTHRHMDVWTHGSGSGSTSTKAHITSFTSDGHIALRLPV